MTVLIRDVFVRLFGGDADETFELIRQKTSHSQPMTDEYELITPSFGK